MPLETDSTLGPAPDGDEDEPRSRPPESWMGPVRDDVRARLFERRDPDPAEPRALKIGRYVVIKRIGEGGMGMVYAAYDDQLDRKVAVKLLQPGHQRFTPNAKARLTREAQAIARLSHPGVVKVYEVGTHGGEVFVAMEYVDGVTLKQWQAKRGWKEVLGRYVAAGRGLEAAHAAGIVHRDFKADNVLVRSDAPHRADGVRVLDFGLASTDPQGGPHSGGTPAPPESDAPVSSLTRTGAVMGTPAYMAPEQHLAAATDGRTDQFSFCVSLFEALHGFRPFAGETLDDLRANVLSGAVEDEPRYTEVPAALSAALRRGLQLNPDDRYPSMGALLDELDTDERPRWRRAAVGVGLAAVGAAAVLQLGGTDTTDLLTEATRVRSAFENTRRTNTADELRRLQARTPAQQWDDLVLSYARVHLDTEPTAVLAALKHLRPEAAGWLNEARGLAADASRHGPVYDALELDYPIERLVAGPSRGDQSSPGIAGISANGELFRFNVSAAGLTSTPIELAGETTRDVAITWDGVLAVVTHDDRLWTFGPGGEALAPPRTVTDVARVAVNPQGTQLALGRRNGTIVVSKLDGTEPRELRGSDHAITHLRFHPFRATLASANTGSEVWMWFLERETHRTLFASDPIDHLAFDNGALIATTRGGGLHWNDLTGAHRDSSWSEGTLDARTANASEATLEANTQGLQARWGSDLRMPLDRSEDHRDFVLSGDGQWALASFASHVRAWSLGDDPWGTRVTGERAVTLRDDVRVVGLAPTDDALLVFGAKGMVLALKPSTVGDVIADLKINIRRVLPQPNGRHVALEDTQGALHVLDIDALDDRPRSLGGPQSRRGGTTVWAPSGEALAICSCPHDGQACVMTMQWLQDTAPVVLGSVSDPATALSVSADGSRLLSGHNTRTVVWSTEGRNTGKVLSLPRRPSNIDRTRAGFAFSPAGRVRLATSEWAVDASEDNRRPTLRVWEAFGPDETLFELFVETNLRTLVTVAGEGGVVLATADGRTLLWMLDEDTFHPLPEGLFETSDIAQPVQVHVAPDRKHLWLAAGSGDTTVVHLATGQRRSLPPLVPPVVWAHDGSLADVARFQNVRQWLNPAPTAPEPFLRWIDAQTRISIGARDLLRDD